MSTYVHLDRLSGIKSHQANHWWLVAVVLQILAIGVNIFATTTNSLAKESALISAILTVCYVASKWRSDRFKQLADKLKRAFEMFDGLGWPVSAKELSDLLVTVSRYEREQAQEEPDQSYFASKAPQSAQRLLENLEESTWWTKHLAGSMALYTSLLCIAVFATAAITLVIALQSTASQTTADTIAKVTTSIVVFVFSGGYFRLAFEYNQFSRGAEQIENQTNFLLQRNGLTDIQATKLLHDYQIIRAGSPLLPNWLWKYRRRDLNELWNQRLNSHA
jgi:Flp pilus assembly protein TadB